MASNGGLQWTVAPSVMANTAGTLGDRLGDLVFSVAQAQASEAESSMKSRAPWVDRTGLARASLTADATKAGNVVTIRLSHGVSYGIELETRNGGRFAAVIPELRERVPKVAAELKGILS